MSRRTGMLCFVVAVLPLGGSRGDAPPGAAAAVAPTPVKPAATGPRGDRLASPVSVEVDGRPLTRGESLVPFVGDLDGDGRPDLLLGTRADGRLLVYRNVGTRARPRLSGPRWFDDAVPTGRIPAG